MAVISAALGSLRRGPLRSALTTLGVVVGVAAVVVTSSIGRGAKERIEQSLASPESRTVYLSAIGLPSAGYLTLQVRSSDNLNVRDYQAIRRSIKDVSASSPQAALQNARVRANGRSSEGNLEGVDTGMFSITRRALIHGSLINQLDVNRAATVCVVSESLARKLFDDVNVSGKAILLNDVTFTIIGVVEDISVVASELFRQENLHVYVPFTSLLRRLGPATPMAVIIQARDVEHVAAVQRAVNDLMEERRSGRRAQFLTSNALQSIKAYSEGSLAVARLLAAMGAISLLVGGIGIMNVMLISVTERTREIGIRMAIGTRVRSILVQFLLEAIVLGALGGVVGVALGIAASQLYAHANGWPMAITLDSIVIGLVCSVTIGVVSGFQPARRAAALSPVLALRNDV
jgi:putative ABC transport system permease protein